MRMFGYKYIKKLDYVGVLVIWLILNEYTEKKLVRVAG